MSRMTKVNGEWIKTAGNTAVAPGVFVDTSRKLKEISTESQNVPSWTATEDCWVAAGCRSNGSSAAQVLLNDGLMCGSVSTTASVSGFMAKKGDVISFREGSSYWYSLRVYPLRNTPISVQAQENYSTEEQIIGTWIDGKPIYRKVFTGSWSISVQNAFTNLLDISSLSINRLVNCRLMLNKGQYNTPDITINGNYLQYYIAHGSWTITTIILEYTKTTD